MRQFEPEMALTTPQGTECYRAIAALAPSLLAAGGVLMFELHADGAAVVSELIVRQRFTEITVFKGLFGA